MFNYHMKIENIKSETKIRQLRGIEIAKSKRIKKSVTGWTVPARSRAKSYLVKPDVGTCTCQDFEDRKLPCKHIFAVEAIIKNKIHNTAPRHLKDRKSYPQDWVSYDKAQTHEKALFMKLLDDLCQHVDKPARKFGRPRMPMSDMVFSSALKVYSTFSLRRFMCDIQIAKDNNYINKVPHYSSVARYMENPKLTRLILQLIEISALPLRTIETIFSVDSTGFSTSQFSRWFDFKYKKDTKRRKWVKAHLMCGVKTNIITGVKIGYEYENDCQQLPELVERTSRNFIIGEVSADKAYLSKYNLKTIGLFGGVPYIPFKKSSNAYAQKSGMWKKAYHFFMYKHDEFLSHYHKRSNVESTISMIKAKFGSHIRSKNDTAQANEVLLKILCHNICVVIQEMHELGIEPQFNL